MTVSFHLHLISDATGETLITVGRAAAAQYTSATPVEHVYALVRTSSQLDRAMREVEENPGIVLYTIIDDDLRNRIEASCLRIGVPAVNVLEPVLRTFQSYLGAPTTPRVGGQHALDNAYFQRIEALNFTMAHDDGQHMDNLNQADVVIVGISRTSKTPTSIYLANRGVKTGNVPIVPDIPISPYLENLTDPLVVGLIASPERIVQIRQNRILNLNAPSKGETYTSRASVAEEIAQTRRICAQHKWPLIDVTRRSIEETAAEILSLRQRRLIDETQSKSDTQ